MISKTFLLTKYNVFISEKLTNIAAELVNHDYTYNNLKTLKSPYCVFIENYFESFKGFVVRGQCSFIHNKSKKNAKVGVIRSFSYMKTEYQGSLESVYLVSTIKSSEFIKLLKLYEINVIITDNSQD